VIPLSDQTLYVLGKKSGTTNVSVLDSSRKIIGVIDVEVGVDAGAVSAGVLAGTGSGGIRARSAGDKVILEGTAADATQVDRAVQIATALAPGGVINTTRVASNQQVMLKVRFIEVNRTAARELGIRNIYQGSKQRAVTGGLPFEEGSDTLLSAIASPNPFARALLRFADNSRLLDVQIDALEEKGLVRRLAEPNLVAMSGGTATFHAGGRIPIPTAQSSSGGALVITTTYEDFGVRLNFQPVVLANGVINMTIAPEVSDIDPTIAVPTGGGLSAPGITVRRATTQLELRDGQSFAMAGLIQSINERNIDQLPWLGSVPVIGTLFRSTSFRQRETELVVIVTPHLVKPGAPGNLIATPLDTTLPSNDADLFLNGKLEVAKPVDPGVVSPTQKWVLENGQKLKGPFGHMLDPEPVPAAVAPVRVASPAPPVVRAKN
jgi:pilus assembly protein CpaC